MLSSPSSLIPHSRLKKIRELILNSRFQFTLVVAVPSNAFVILSDTLKIVSEALFAPMSSDGVEFVRHRKVWRAQ